MREVSKGERFGRWKLVLFAGKAASNGVPRWLCVCECGVSKIVSLDSLLKGTSRSCGCLRREVSGRVHRSHGSYNTPEYKIWASMKQRCNDPSQAAYHNYGGRGIKVCERWESFENFIADMGERPSPKHSLDRIDVNGNYEPSNCRWALWNVQQNNRRNNLALTLNGETRTMAQWCAEFSMSLKLVWRRVNVLGWSLEKALTTPIKRTS